MPERSLDLTAPLPIAKCFLLLREIGSHVHGLKAISEDTHRYRLQWRQGPGWFSASFLLVSAANISAELYPVNPYITQVRFVASSRAPVDIDGYLNTALQRITEPFRAALAFVGSIFISYRREDSADACGRIYDRLGSHFGREAIIKDVDSIPPGVDLRLFISQLISNSRVALVVVGKRWVEIKGPNSQMRRLDDPLDWVAAEVEAVLRLGIAVIPLLVSGATMPDGSQLPIALKELAYRNAFPIRPDPDFHKDVDRLIPVLEGILRG